MKYKRIRMFSFFHRGSPCGAILLLRLRHLTTDGGYLVCTLLIQFYINQFKTLQALLSWSVDVHMVLALSSIYFVLLFSTFEISHFVMVCRYACGCGAYVLRPMNV